MAACNRGEFTILPFMSTKGKNNTPHSLFSYTADTILASTNANTRIPCKWWWRVDSATNCPLQMFYKILSHVKILRINLHAGIGNGVYTFCVPYRYILRIKMFPFECLFFKLHITNNILSEKLIINEIMLQFFSTMQISMKFPWRQCRF